LALAEAVGRRKGWSARVFMPDDPACMAPLDKAPLRSIDPWELKLALWTWTQHCRLVASASVRC